MKKIISLIACGAIIATGVVGFAACDDKNNKKPTNSTVKLTLWGPSAQQDSLGQMVEAFKAANPDKTYDITLGVCGEGDAYANLSTDPKSGADVFAFANDQIVNIYKLGVLSPVSPSTVTALKESSDKDSVEFARIGDNYYGYPYSVDNGYFLYYDSSILSAEDVKDLDTIIKKCKAANKTFGFEIKTAWYANSFVYGAGGTYSIGVDEEGNWKDVSCNFDQKAEGSNYTYGELGGQAIADMVKYDNVVIGDDAVIDSQLADGTFGAYVRGTWKANDIKNGLGDDYAATALPSWKSSLDGKTYPLAAFIGGKLYGVNAYSANAAEAHKLANFLVSKEMQEKRFDDNGIGPANLEVAKLAKVTGNVALAALKAQQEKCSLIQIPMPDGYWTAAGSFAEAMAGDAAPKDAELLERVKAYVTELKTV